MRYVYWRCSSRVARISLIALIGFSIGVQVLGAAIHPFSYIVTRNNVVTELASSDLPRYSYADSYSENAFTNFSPMFSHIVGNWWLFKHMLINYDLWSDVPWRSIGAFSIEKPIWVRGNRTIPFWWPAGIPLIVPSSRDWVRALAGVNLLFLLWFGLRLMRVFRTCSRGEVSQLPYALRPPGCRQSDERNKAGSQASFLS